MPDSLIRAKIKEALLATANNQRDAYKLLITWAVRDPSLLLEMTKPHLKAIAAGLVDHHVRHAEAGNDENGPDNISRNTIDDIITSAALHLPHDKRKTPGLPPPKSTERQATTMRKLAAAFTRKKKE
ncbi:MAG: hypothetical protein WCD70_03770 [Alphaproteobacteria bacterium]